MVAEPWQIEDFGDGSNMALCIASTKAIWNPFKQYICDLVARNESIPLNPLDTFNSIVIHAAVSKAITTTLLPTERYQICTHLCTYVCMHAIIYVSDSGREDSPGKEDEVIYKVYTDWNCEEPCHLQTMGSLTGAFVYVCMP